MTSVNGETDWRVPATWWRHVEVIRGRSPGSTAIPVTPRKSATSTARLSEVAADYEGACKDSFLPEADAEFLAEHQPGSGVLELLAAACAWERCAAPPRPTNADACLEHLVNTRGVSFTARCLVVAAALSRDWEDSRVVRVREWVDLNNFHVLDAHSRLRGLVAQLRDDEYQSLAVSLDKMRGLTLAGDVVASFLLPTQRHWVAEDIETFASNRVQDKWPGLWLMASVTSVAEVEEVLGIAEFAGAGEPSRDNALWALGQKPRLVYSMCANVGPGCEYVVAELFEGTLSAKHKKLMARLLADFDTDAGLAALVHRLDRKYAEPAFLDAMAASPQRAARLLKDVGSVTAERLLRDIARTHPDLAPQTDAPVSSMPESSKRDLPALLLDPPWHRRAQRTKPLVLRLMVPSRDLAVSWLEGEREQWGQSYHPDDDGQEYSLGVERYLEKLANAPDDVARRYLSDWPVPTYLFRAEPTLRRILTRFDSAAVDFVYRVVMSRPSLTAGVLLPVTGSEVSARMLDWLATKSIRPVAMQWFRRHIDTAAADLVASTLAASGAQRRRTEELVGRLGRDGHRARLLAAAATLGGDEVHTEVTRILDTDPLDQLPTRIPTIPEWLSPQLLPPVRLAADGRNLPPEAITTITVMLAMSRIGDEYSGVATLRELVIPEDLAAFAREIFDRWASAGHPAGQDWALHTLGITGDDITVGVLAPLVQTWPLESAHRRAATGLDVFAEIGTDAALYALWQVADGLRYPALRRRADDLIRRVADELDLAPEDLADRIIPRLGFDDRSSMTIDYGWTSFSVRLTSRLQPLIADSSGTPLRSLPPPSADDGPEAREAHARFGRMQRELTTVGPELINRLESAMVTERAWTLGVLQKRYLVHPLMWPLCSALLWSTDAGTLFRFTDPTREPVDGMGRALLLDTDTLVRVVHPVTVAADDLSRWQAVFEHLTLDQPCEQLWRAVFDGDVTEELTRYEHVKVTTRELLALRRHGWVREEAQDKGAQIALHKTLGGHTTATMLVFPGFNVTNVTQWKHQRIVDVTVTGETGEPPSAISGSELVRDLATLRVRPIIAADTDLLDRTLGFEVPGPGRR